MKIIKPLLSLTILFITVSCSSDDIFDEYGGTWNLSLVKISNSSPDYTETIQFQSNTIADENCLANSTLQLKDDNTAILSLTSNVSTSLEIVDGTINELEQITSCENTEDIKLLTWTVGDYEVTNPDGSSTTVSSSPYTLRLFEENGDVLFTGSIDNGKLFLNSGIDNFIEAEIEGEIIEFVNIKVMDFYR